MRLFILALSFHILAFAAMESKAADAFPIDIPSGAWAGLRDAYTPPEEIWTPINWEHGTGNDLPIFELAYDDEGIGPIRPRICFELDGESHCLAPVRKANHIGFKTGEARKAWFEFDFSMLEGKTVTANLRMMGVYRYKSGTRLIPAQDDAAWQAMRDAAPKITAPVVEVSEGLELVTTLGIDVVGGLETLQASLDNIDELAPLAKALGFTAIESYVTWKRIEAEAEGQFDFAFYDTIVEKLAEYDLQWFPLLIVGSAYALPEWFIESEENQGMYCLEHGLSNPVQSIWYEPHRRHVERVLHAFGEHYEPMGVLEGVRLGPSGNYGESQYPAGGNWGPKGKAMHIHIGWWAGDSHAEKAYRAFVEECYGTIDKLNDAWGTSHKRFKDVAPRLPAQMLNPRERIDFTEWYTDSMSDWCAWWAEVANDAMPNTHIYQSAGGWGFREAGTDYSAQTKTMAQLNGGIRLTNETDSFEQNFYATRLATTAARHYGADLGFEPASSHTARGVAGRLFNVLTTNGDHFFTYHNNIFNTQYAIEQWEKHLPLLAKRADPIIDVAVYYPETFNQIEDSAFRHLYAWGFNPRAREIRRVIDCDYLDERLIRDGFLDQYKVLVFVWGNIIEADVQEKIDDWIQQGGIVFYPSFPKGDQRTVEGDRTTFKHWNKGDTDRGHFHRFPGDMEPPSLYGDFLRNSLLMHHRDALHPLTRRMLNIRLPEHVFLSALEDSGIWALNYSDGQTELTDPGGAKFKIDAYEFKALK